MRFYILFYSFLWFLKHPSGQSGRRGSGVPVEIFKRVFAVFGVLLYVILVWSFLEFYFLVVFGVFCVFFSWFSLLVAFHWKTPREGGFFL